MCYMKMRGLPAPHHHQYSANLAINTLLCKSLSFFYHYYNKIVESCRFWEICVIFASLKKEYYVAY